MFNVFLTVVVLSGFAAIFYVTFKLLSKLWRYFFKRKAPIKEAQTGAGDAAEIRKNKPGLFVQIFYGAFLGIFAVLLLRLMYNATILQESANTALQHATRHF